MFTLTTLLLMIPLTLASESTQPRTVCQALLDQTDLNGKEVSVRGAIAVGDAMRDLFASPACAQRTVRDGWIWPDAISIWPMHGGLRTMGETITLVSRMQREHPNCKIVGTVMGRMETRSHFAVHELPSGEVRPIGYGEFVANLAYERIDHLEAVPLEQEEIEEQKLPSHRNPHAIRVGDGPKQH